MFDMRLRREASKFRILDVTGVNDLFVHVEKSVASAVREMNTVYTDASSSLPSVSSAPASTSLSTSWSSCAGVLDTKLVYIL
jgi:hypothetical protein